MLHPTASLAELAAMIRRGETTPTALTLDALDDLDHAGRDLNAVVTLTADRALREAARAEAELAAGRDRGPLHGIPYGAKDLLATAAIPTTWGAVPYRDQVFEHDAAVVERLEAAGAVLVAKLAMVELAGGMGYDQPDAALTGPGRNPWDREAWAGGSSSGSGAAVGGRLVPFAIGSETQGSIITPAAFCGVSGLRPTYGRVSRFGAMALSPTMDKLGPMCRTADDCGLVLAAVAGPDGRDPTSAGRRFAWPPARPRTAGFRLAVPTGATEQAEPEVAANFEASLDVLRGFATVEEVALPDLPYPAVSTLIIAAEASAGFDDLIGSGGIAALTAPEDRVVPYSFETISARDYLRAMRVRRRIAEAMADLCAPYDAIVSPALPRVATPLDVPFRRAFAGRGPAPPVPGLLTAAANLAGLPAVAIPDGFGARGLPTSLQFTGRAWSEARLLAAAAAYQARTDWHTRTPK